MTQRSKQRVFSPRSAWSAGGTLLPLVLLVAALSDLPAQSFRKEGYSYFKDLTLPQPSDRATYVYGRLRIDKDIVAAAGTRDVVPAMGDRALPYFRRPVPPPKGEVGTRTPRVVFHEVRRGRRSIYTLELPAVPPGTEYTSLSVVRKGTFETAAAVALADKPGAWRPIGSRSVFQYRGSADTEIRFRSGSSRFVRLEFGDGKRYSFPTARYVPVRRVSEFRSDLSRADLKDGFLPDEDSSVFYLANEKRRNLHRLVLRFAEPRFRRRLVVQAMSPGSRSYEEIMTVTIERASDDGADQVIDLPDPVSGALKLVIRNESDQPLGLKEFEAYSPLEELVFQLPEADRTGPLRVYYSNPYARRLQFDIEETYDSALPQLRARAGEQQKNPDFGYSAVEPPLSTWIIRLVFALGLIGVLLPAFRVFRAYASPASAS